MIVGSSCLLLALVWGGHEHAWGSPQVLGLIAAGVLASLLFVLVERRAVEGHVQPA